MSKQEWIDWLDSVKARYEIIDDDEKDVHQIWVFSREEYDMKKAHPRKYKDLYVPYIRLSNFDADKVYTRWNGLTGDMTNDGVKGIIVYGI